MLTLHLAVDAIEMSATHRKDHPLTYFAETLHLFIAVDACMVGDIRSLRDGLPLQRKLLSFIIRIGHLAIKINTH